MSPINDKIREVLLKRSDKDLFITIGNTLRTDDGVGPYVFLWLEKILSLSCLNAGYTPENIIDDVIAIEPKRILFIDAADFNGAPGEIRIIDQEHIPEGSISTHGISLKVIASILYEDTKAEIIFLGIQPKNVGFGEGLSTEVQQAADELIQVIKENY